MDVIYGLIPGMIFLGLIMVGVLVWAVKSGQYEDFEGDANRILMDDDDPLLPTREEKNTTPEEQAEAKERAARREDKSWPDAD